jgi:hypothetical protein
LPTSSRSAAAARRPSPKPSLRCAPISPARDRARLSRRYS